MWGAGRMRREVRTGGPRSVVVRTGGPRSVVVRVGGPRFGEAAGRVFEASRECRKAGPARRLIVAVKLRRRRRASPATVKS